MGDGATGRQRILSCDETPCPGVAIATPPVLMDCVFSKNSGPSEMSEVILGAKTLSASPPRDINPSTPIVPLDPVDTKPRGEEGAGRAGGAESSGSRCTSLECACDVAGVGKLAYGSDSEAAPTAAGRNG